jgi:predicted DNA-binding protein (MmcQ/YjbR family)
VNLEKLRKHCLAYPGATEQIQWGADLVFKVGGRMFVVAATEPEADHRLSFKCGDEGFAELIEQDGIIPAPYLARAKWVTLETFDALSDREIEQRIRDSYDLVFAKLTKKDQAAIASPAHPTPRAKSASKPPAASTSKSMARKKR